tara:strand:- start:321 stop:497 length:177 start_codon:yes stop_codon:yes gene_type:complete
MPLKSVNVNSESVSVSPPQSEMGLSQVWAVKKSENKRALNKNIDLKNIDFSAINIFES